MFWWGGGMTQESTWSIISKWIHIWQTVDTKCSSVLWWP